MSLIKKGIVIGNWNDASNLEFLRRMNISHVLCSAAELSPVYPGRFTYKHVMADDIPEYNLSRHFDQAADFIHQGVNSGGTVFIHCAAGISRSVSLTLAYMIKYEQQNLSTALNMIRKRRYIANPNPGFMQQLRVFERRFNKLGYRANSMARHNEKTESKPISYLNRTSIETNDYKRKSENDYLYGKRSTFNSDYAPKAWAATSTLDLRNKYESVSSNIRSRLNDLDNHSGSRLHTTSTTVKPQHDRHSYLDTYYEPYARKLSHTMAYTSHYHRSRQYNRRSQLYDKYLRANRQSSASQHLDMSRQSVRDNLCRKTMLPVCNTISSQDYGSLRRSYRF